ncbi:MAG: VTC domain-containing protein, partial [Oligoflexia bacterium]|nr:VTC domain-containing protein [Oligoflexia bacterium]
MYEKYSLVPSIKISYLRHAFELNDIRVTIDYNITSNFL